MCLWSWRRVGQHKLCAGSLRPTRDPPPRVYRLCKRRFMVRTLQTKLLRTLSSYRALTCRTLQASALFSCLAPLSTCLSTMTTSSTNAGTEVYLGVPMLNQPSAYQLDQDLMTTPGFSIDQLMELAGLSVAASILDAYPAQKKILIVAGPGNNGRCSSASVFNAIC